MFLTLVRDTSSISLVTTFTKVTFNQICDYVIMTVYVIIKEVDPLFGCTLLILYYIPPI